MKNRSGLIALAALAAATAACVPAVAQAPTGKVTVGKDHHVTLEMFTAKTEGAGLTVVENLGQIAPQPGCA